MNPAKVQFYRDRQKKARWRIIRSGRIIAESGEGYSSRSKAARTLANLVIALRAGRFQVL
jgi:uncharacterized protein YegP (UPF0339 family)